MLTLPFPRNPFFTGREDQLAAIHTALTSRGRAALSGLGGIGKTQTAVEYAYRYRDDYRYVFWVGADTELELTSGYVAIAQRLNLPLKDAENQDETVQYVRLWLSRETGWLLIFDNADQPELVQPFLPREIQGHILVTSRTQDFQDLGIVQPVTMETLNPEEAVEFLLTRTGRPHSVGAHPRVRPPQGIEPLVDHPDGQSALRQDAIPPTPLGKGGSSPGTRAEDLFPPNPLGKGGSGSGVTTDNWSSPLLRGVRGDQNPGRKQSAELQAATALAAELGYLPLALEQAAAYIVTNRVPFTDYLNSYRKQRLKRLEKAKPKLGHYADSVATTWALNLKEVQKQAPAAAALLNYCAFLHPDAIPFNLFTQGAAELGEPLATALANAADDPLEIYDLLHPLCSYSLVRVEPESQSFSLHRLVQEVIRFELGENICGQLVEYLFQAILQLKSKVLNYRDWSIIFEPLVNHVQELSQYCYIYNCKSIHAADLFQLFGSYLLERSQYVLAEPLFQQSILLYQSLISKENPEVASVFIWLAMLYKRQSRYTEADCLYKKSLTIYQNISREDSDEIVIILGNLGELYRCQGLYGEAEAILQKALAMSKRLLANESSIETSILNNLALVYYELEDYESSELLYKEALAIDQKEFGSDSPAIATDLHNLALVYRNQGKYVEAEELFSESLSMKQNLLTAEHPLLSDTLFGLGVLYLLKQEFKQALEMLQQSLDLDKKVLGETHPNTAESLRAIGDVYAAQGRTEEARSHYQQALAILEPKLGAEHPWTVRCHENLAKLDQNEAPNAS